MYDDRESALPDIRKSMGGRPGSVTSQNSNGRASRVRSGLRSGQDYRGHSRNSGSRGQGESQVEHRQIITQRIVKDQEKVDKFFKDKADQLKNIASYQR